MLEQNDAEVIEFNIPPDSSLIDKELMSIKFPDGIKIGAIIRGEEVIIPKGNDVIAANDHIIVLCLVDVVSKAEKFFTK